MADTLKIVGISGSLRKDSFNTALLHAAAELMPAGVEFSIVTLHEIELFNEDVEREGFPAAVVALREAISSADALLIATPEYNYSIPGVLKNALDWASRPGSNGEMPLSGKPLGIIGASVGAYGTARGQHHLRQVTVNTNMHPLNKPEVMITFADKKFSAGQLHDEPTRKVVRTHLEALVAWTKRLSQ
ncbi:NADPH-dependent FMN reductase [Herpetosiphon giganteus]|uniref:NADPH-dependent FMN reductase n=1 Tax=Herpetosiphon giganteus TaxID=2029754 RepID=UPI0019562161|nr:NADPH-dependent FMN reductase [Herpetosiphon giganteus]MBM7842376.1 chromate reductase [Herpetosiphon giganteus]